MRVTGCKPLDKLILITIASRAKENGECVITDSHLADICETSVGALIISTGRLQKAGHLRIYRDCEESAYLLNFGGEFH
ncbi:hypothetical protein BEE12_16160 [Pantoea agglomerans]|nr:hypothetical protein BEE12_16160 [Pantoea agglomerans]